jgi:hypothetical protein
VLLVEGLVDSDMLATRIDELSVPQDTGYRFLNWVELTSQEL